MSIWRKGIYTLRRTPEYKKWYDEQIPKARLQIDDRLSRIELEGHFGDHKSVDTNNEIWELKWENGRRVYYAYEDELKLAILLGGNKNGQSKDIIQAKRIFKKNIETRKTE